MPMICKLLCNFNAIFLGRRYGAHAGLALEAQRFPDSPNHPQFPAATLRPGAVYAQRTEYRFAVNP